MRILGLIVAVAVFAAVGWWAWTQRPGQNVQVDSGDRVVMGTFSRVVVIGSSRPACKQAIEAVFKDQQEIEHLMSFHRSDSELAKVNAEAYDRPVRISEPMMDVLAKAMEVSRLSEGAFDVTVGPLMDLWKAAGQAHAMPTDEEIAAVMAKVGWDKVHLDPSEKTVRFTVQGMKLDLGGIAKGYAVDRSVRILKEQGILGGMVDLGGNIRCFGQAPQGSEYWRIGIQDPCQVEDLGSPGEGVLLILKLTDQAVATSGHYRRFVMVGDRKVSHILDPRTGKSNEQVSSVTIIAPDAMTADAMTKPVCLLPGDKAMALVKALPGIEAIVMTPDRTGAAPGRLIITKTPGADQVIVAR